MKLRITAICDKGCVRSSNEDMILVGKKLLRDDRLQGAIEPDKENSVFMVAVADGMGGANAGEVASQMVLEMLSKAVYELPKCLDDEALRATISAVCLDIHKKVLQGGASDSAKRGMGSTLVALLYYEGRLIYVNAGDSRLYRFRSGTLMQLSCDHSLRNLSGVTDAPSNVIVNSFGGGNSFYVDIEPPGRKTLDGDIFLLCSDGLSDTLTDEEIEVILNKEGFEDSLLKASMDRSAEDNVSYVLVEVSEVGG